MDKLNLNIIMKVELEWDQHQNIFLFLQKKLLTIKKIYVIKLKIILLSYSFFNDQNYEKKLKSFNVIGYVIARTLNDDRFIDFPLNSIFWELLQRDQLILNPFKKLIKIYELKRKTKNNDKIIIYDKNLESVHIYFNCPLNELNPLKEHSENILLKANNNIDENIILVFKYLLIDGMKEIKN